MPKGRVHVGTRNKKKKKTLSKHNPDNGTQRYREWGDFSFSAPAPTPKWFQSHPAPEDIIFSFFRTVKGTVSREKFFNRGLGEMDWTLTIDRTCVLHFSNQLFNCYKILTVCRLDVKPVWWLSGIVALRWLIVHAVVAVSWLLVCCTQ